MIHRVCGQSNPAGTMYCETCGTPLHEPDLPVRTAPVATAEPAEPAAALAPVLQPDGAASWLLVLPAGTVVPLLRGAPLLLGRDEPGLVGQGFAGCDNVSRAHAQIALTDAGPTITDLSSTNGTWRDGKRLLPGIATPLTEHSEIRLAADRVLRLVRQIPGEEGAP